MAEDEQTKASPDHTCHSQVAQTDFLVVMGGVKTVLREALRLLRH